MVELGMTFSMEQLVIDNDMISMFKKAMEGVVINDKTLAIDSIKEVGAGNDFIGQPTTMEYMGIQSKPLLFNREMLGDWRAAGSKDVVEVAHAIVKDVIKSHKVLEIPADRLKAMEAVVKKADEEYAKTQQEEE